jgi:hypothetical protein
MLSRLLEAWCPCVGDRQNNARGWCRPWVATAVGTGWQHCQATVAKGCVGETVPEGVEDVAAVLQEPVQELAEQQGAHTRGCWT